MNVSNAPSPPARSQRGHGHWMGLLLLCAAAALGTTGCLTVGPDYAAPDGNAPGNWHSALAEGVTSGPLQSEQLAQWWEAFDDPILDGLIQTALEQNLDLKSAQSRVRQARAQRTITRAGLWPSLSFSGSAKSSHTTTQNKLTGTQEVEQDLYSTGFDASWELDVFGGQRRALEASTGQLEATQAGLYDVQVSLLAEVATAYVQARSYQARIELAQANLEAQMETHELVLSRFQVGVIDELDVQQSRYSYESTAAQIPNLRTGLEENLNSLAILLGQAPGTVHEQLAAVSPIPAASQELAVGVPSEALRRRPDIRQAERELAAQTAEVGVAVADLYPKFYLTGSLSRQGIGTKGYADYPTRGWSVGPSVSWDIFRAGALRNQVKVQTELQEQALLAYENTVLGALQEVENKLYALGQEQQRRQSLQAAAEAAQKALAISREQYRVGVVSFTDVLGAEQSLVSFQDNLAQSQATIALNQISIYKALGGGWTPLQPGQLNPSAAQ